mgnify:CR=1 FL=1
MAKKKSFILYADYIKHIGKLSDEDAGRLFKAIFDYVNEGKLPNLDGMAAMAFSFISNQLDNDLQKYEETCRKRSENVKKRWAKANASQNSAANTPDTKNTSAYNCIFCNTNDTDNDIDSVNDTDNDIDSDIDNGSVLHNISARGAHHTIHLTEQEYKSLCEKYGQAVIDQYIDRIDQYLTTNGKKPYTNHYQTVIKWLESDKVKPLSSASFDLDEIFQHALTTTPTVKRKD